MKVIIAGGRDFVGHHKHLLWLDRIHTDFYYRDLDIEEVVSGAASGADEFGEKWAENMDIPVVRFYPDWEGCGKLAGPMRNRAMLDYVGTDGALIVFPGGRGTADIVRQAEGLGIRIISYEE